MSLSEEELLFNNKPYVRIYGSVDDSNIASSDTFISSGSFEVRKTVAPGPVVHSSPPGTPFKYTNHLGRLFKLSVSCPVSRYY